MILCDRMTLSSCSLRRGARRGRRWLYSYSLAVAVTRGSSSGAATRACVRARGRRRLDSKGCLLINSLRSLAHPICPLSRFSFAAMPEHIPPRLDVGGGLASSSNAPTATTTTNAASNLPIANGASAASLADAAFSIGKTVFIDNYDSFTYNIVQVREAAR